MNRKFACIGSAVLLALAAGILLAQSADDPKFELADVHPSPAAAPGGRGGQYMAGGFYRGGRYDVRTASLLDLIRAAYAIDTPDKIIGGPEWLDKDRFDILAKAPANSTPENLRLMLKNLLADRFKLVVHTDTRTLPAYALRVGKSVKMKPGDGDGDTGCKLQPQAQPAQGEGRGGVVMMSSNGGTVTTLNVGSLIVYNCRNIEMAAMPDELLKMVLSRQYLTNSRIVDETELKGTWNFDLKYSLKLPMIGPAANPDEDTVTFFDAIEKQLGLKLELSKAPFPVVVVDSVNEKPTDNLPGITAQVPPQATEFEVAEIKPSDPNAPARGVFTPLFGAGGRVNLPRDTMTNLIGLAWNLNGNANSRIIGLPKSLETAQWDIVAKAPTMAPVNVNPNMPAPPPQVDFDTVRVMLQALLKDRFSLSLHEEERPMPGYALVAVKPKLKPADPSERPGCSNGPGPYGKDPRTTNPQAGRLFTCLNYTLAEFAADLPDWAGGYFGQYPGGIVDATKLEGKFDITINFSGAGMVNGPIGGGGRGGGEIGNGAAPGAGEAADPSGAISLQEAIEKQLGLKLVPQKNPAKVLVIDHIEEKPSDN